MELSELRSKTAAPTPRAAYPSRRAPGAGASRRPPYVLLRCYRACFCDAQSARVRFGVVLLRRQRALRHGPAWRRAQVLLLDKVA